MPPGMVLEGVVTAPEGVVVTVRLELPVRAVVEMDRLPKAPDESWRRFTIVCPEVVDAVISRVGPTLLIAAARDVATSARVLVLGPDAV